LRDLLLWGTAVLFLLAALYTVTLRREVYALAREIGDLEERTLEQVRRADNLALHRELLRSPRRLRDRAERAGILRVAAVPRRQ
jgi:cell division protein FtsL